MKLTEAQIEDVFQQYYKELLWPDLEYVARQHKLESGLRVDLLFRKPDGTNVVLELKKDAVTREDVGQTLQYAGMIRNSRVVLAAPLISESIKKAFSHYGIDYLEFNIEEIKKLYLNLKGDKPVGQASANPVTLPQNVVKEPLQVRTNQDGNIAFKVTYVDSDWSGVCSSRIYNYNIIHRTWCKVQSQNRHNCRSAEYSDSRQLNDEHFPCYDSVALKTLSFSPGWTHTGPKDQPLRCLEAKVGKLALFTSREPGEPEESRYVFAVAPIISILPPFNKKFDNEIFYCDSTRAIRFLHSNRPKFWNHYQNPNAPEKKTWGTGLFRYVNDKIVRSLLLEIVDSHSYNDQIRQSAGKLLTQLS